MGDPETSGGTAHGLNAYAGSMNIDTLNSLDMVMTEVAQWIENSSGCFLGHVKMAVTTSSGTMTLNLTDLRTGVEHHNVITNGEYAEIRFMAAVVDVDHNELAKKMRSSLLSNNIKLKDKKIIELV
ncbi:MAG: hypothetical protein FWD37_03430 [Methanomassiliicoccaceae archaeon]|nr:hypothetical protein [Methanomassiliicoccaceae archaeon]